MREKILNKIDDPAKLRQLKIKELPQLAQEIRECIIHTVSKNGGHLASSLGVVELTISIHYVFDTPKDIIIWDVGHQCYAHKILTGRRELFPTLRQHGGISGFPRKVESVYDPFDVGHSSTSISAGLGVRMALDHMEREGKVVVVIGDGSMTAGMAFEALDHAGSLKKDLIVILNDNEMSISPNVGALSSYLSRILTGQLYTRIREEIKHFLKTIPGVGQPVSKWVKKWEEYTKGLISPGLLFEELGFKYVGPLDGHHFKNLIETLRNVKKLSGPILVHVTTKKGKGFPPAEANPTKFHGIGPFDPITGREIRKPKPPSYTSVFGSTLVRLAEKDPRIVAITAAMKEGTGLSEFAERFPDRFYDVGIAEQHGVTFAAGLASQGLRPVVAIYSTFLQRAYDQVLHDVCLQDLPVVFAMDRAGIVGEDGPTHHGLFDISYLRHLPNMVIMAPKDEAELQRMLVTALKLAHPCAIRYPRGAGVGVDLMEGEIKPLELGRCEVISTGEDLVIIAVGSTVYPSLEAAGILQQRGIHCTVVNARFVKPLDSSRLLPLIRRIGRVITVEENVLAGGFGSAVLEMINDGLGAAQSVQVKRLGINDTFVEHGSQEILRAKHGIDSRGIVKAALQWLGLPAVVETRGREAVV
jgi:1-deoxy-D-xylulose-5-phosphate synthase